MNHDETAVFVHFNRSPHSCSSRDQEEILVTIDVEALSHADGESLFERLSDGSGEVGLLFDPLGDPQWIEIESDLGRGCGYRGPFFLLDRYRGAFAIRAPRALVELLIPVGTTEETFPCEVDLKSYTLSFALPAGRSLLSLFFSEGLSKPAPCEALSLPHLTGD